MKQVFSKILTAALLMSPLAGPQVQAQPDRNAAAYNLESGVGLKGYDPVSYFPEGQSKPRKGSIRYGYKGVTYFFADQKNLETFLKNPEKYEPTYGGFCAWAMSQGSKIDIVPDLYTVNGNRLHLFFSRRAKANFDRDIPKYEPMADANWKKFSGESPRF